MTPLMCETSLNGSSHGEALIHTAELSGVTFAF